ncbi:ATP-binding protein [Leptospira ellisii]|uniref:ATP-binding protein n=1 Tax=Leptospira ellisii TaxID=2023197 RepID=A0A2N0B7S3_9LEPT|nr:ATP-binding protein [Leptospira ellisii]MDV6237834.1 ATP-binding protein [Leptospira ellisii]PJZ92597.1 ATPase [Leptospira ellisii]PKA04775.1 ATPase [Leptospira ellisii]
MKEEINKALEECKDVFVETKNAKRVLKFCKNVINRNQWAVVTGKPGVGKSEIRKELIRQLENNKKNIVIEVPVFHSVQPRSSAIMKEMIRAINPDVHVPGAIESKYKLLRSVLVDALDSGNKVVIVFEESHNLSHNMMRELKLIHEIEAMGKTHLFAMVMFLQATPQFGEIFRTREIGKRVLLEEMDLPSPEESIEIAEKRFNLSFKDDYAKSDFLDTTGDYPASIKHLAQSLWLLPEFNGVVTRSSLTTLKAKAFKEALLEYKISNRMIMRYIKKETKEEISVGYINEALNHKRNGTKAEAVREYASKLLNEVKDEAKAV